MSFEIIGAYELSLAEQAAIANEAFAGYVGGWADLNAETLARFLCLQGADLVYSRFVRTRSGLVGFGYINRTGNILRLAGMGIVPPARGSGAADHLLVHLLEEAKSRGDEAMMLEVIEQNPRAHAFYRRHGFQEKARLYGWRRTITGLPLGDAPPAKEISILRAFEILCKRDYPSLPWQITRHAITKVERTQAFQLGNSCVVIGDPAISPIRVHGFFSNSSEWDGTYGVMLGVLRLFPDREFFAPAIFPEKFGDRIFGPLGFAREALTQSLMRRDL